MPMRMYVHIVMMMTDVPEESKAPPGLLSLVQVVHAEDEDVISEELPPAIMECVDQTNALSSEDTLSDLKSVRMEDGKQHQSSVVRERTFLNKTIICLIGTLSIVSLAHIIFDAIIPTIMAMSRKEGGLEMDSERTAILQSFGAFAGMAGQFTVYFPMMKRWGAVTSSRVGMLFLIPLFGMFPFIVLSSQTSVLMWALLIVVFCVRAVTVVLTYPCINIMGGKAPPPELRGRATGITHSTACSMLAVGPFGGSAFFTFLLGTGLSNFMRNSIFCLLFLLISAVGVGCAFTLSQVYWFVDENNGEDIFGQDESGAKMDDVDGLELQEILICDDSKDIVDNDDAKDEN
jgi:hypothetical protein